MYNNYFGFSVSPFENNLDQRFLFFSANHKEITAALLYFIKWKKGFALVCGDVGTGKTMLINHMLSKLPASVHPILIANPDVGYVEILRYVAGTLQIDAKGKRVLDLVDLVKAALVEACGRGERFVLIIDEAHLLPDKSIEQIRLLSNIETQEHKLFQILLLGQYELSYKLDRPEMRQLRQRININRFLAPMDASETIQYIDHRLKMANSSFGACFEPQCRHLIFKMTRGVPRSINQLCDSALLICKANKRQKVNRNILKKAAAALRSDILFTPRAHSRMAASSSFWKFLRPLAALGAAAMILILLAIFGNWGGVGEKLPYFPHRPDPSVLTPPVALQQPMPDPVVNPGPSPAAVKPDMHDAAPHSPGIDIQPAGLPVTKTAEQETGSEAVLAEINRTEQSQSPASAQEETGNGDGAPSRVEKDIQSVNHVLPVHDPQKWVVKKGDTLTGIAARFFPENKEEGVKKILAVNPAIADMNQILSGQILIIPESVLSEKDLN